MILKKFNCLFCLLICFCLGHGCDTEDPVEDDELRFVGWYDLVMLSAFSNFYFPPDVEGTLHIEAGGAWSLQVSTRYGVKLSGDSWEAVSTTIVFNNTPYEGRWSRVEPYDEVLVMVKPPGGITYFWLKR